MQHIRVGTGCTAQDITVQSCTECAPLGAQLTCLLKMLLSFQDVVEGIENISEEVLKVDIMQVNCNTSRGKCEKLLIAFDSTL